MCLVQSEFKVEGFELINLVCLVMMLLILDQEMESHSNYKDMMKTLTQIQDQFDKKHQNWTLEGSHETELKLKRFERDSQMKQLKFVTTVCNRIVHHLNHQG